MSTPRHTPIPPEIQEAIQQKPAEEQERLRQVWQLLGHLDFEDLDSDYIEEINVIGKDLKGESLNIPDTEAALADLEKAIDSAAIQPGLRAEDRPAKHHKKSTNTRSIHRSIQWTTTVASLFLALFVVMIWYWRVPVVIKAPFGEQVTVLFPDNSSVTLNSGSRMEYARRFESWPFIKTTKRRVFLQGEAFFEVEKMEKPFLVESFNAQVRVLGTAFNVWSREHDNVPETRVTLSSGSVLVTPHDEEDQMTTLSKKGQLVRVVTHTDGIIESLQDTVPIERATAWRSNGFSALDLSVASIVSEIERRYALSITLENSVDASHPLTVFIQEEPTAEELIESMCLSIGCQYRQTSNGFSIFSP